MYRLIFVLGAALFTSFNNYNKPKSIKLSGYAQGTTWQIHYYATDSLVIKSSIDSIFYVMDSSMSLYKPNSLINKFNQSERGIKINKHLEIVVNKSLAIFKETNGIFDITVKPLVQVWGFGVNKTEIFPDSIILKSILTCVGSDKIMMRNDSLIKKNSCVEIDLNGIAQGYTVDLIAEFLEKNEVVNYLVEVGGEIRIKGAKAGGENFRIGIDSPNDSGAVSIKKVITVDNGAITTSGNYIKYKLQGKNKISHLINAKTGYPVFNEMISVTVWAKDAITSDGYDNVFMNLGVKESLRYLETRTDMAAYFIYHTSDSSVVDTASAGFNKFFNNR